MADEKLILLTNDDGIHSPALAVAEQCFGRVGRVVVCAPDRERSAVGHAFTMGRPLRARPRGPDRYAVDGTPADCVYLGANHLAGRTPDLVVSGPNRGFNLGTDVFYSGTVAGAAEAAVRSIPGIALSTPVSAEPETYRTASEFALHLMEAVWPLRETIAAWAGFLNVNVPAGEIAGYRWTRLGRRHYPKSVEVRNDPKGRPYYWIGGPLYEDTTGGSGEDMDAVQNGLVSITPLALDMTSEPLLEQLRHVTLRGYDYRTTHGRGHDGS